MKKLVKHGFSLCGIFFILGAVLIMSLSAGAQKRCTEEVVGTVVSYEEHYDASERSYSYYPVVEYMASRKRIETTASSGSGSTPYEIGAAVSVKYNPDDPYEFVFSGDNSAYKWGIYLIVVGAGCIVLDVLSAKGIIGETVVHRTYHHNYNGSGVSIDLGGIVRAAQAAKTIKGSIQSLRDMTPEERKALYEAVNEHPEQFIHPEDIEEEDEE